MTGYKFFCLIPLTLAFLAYGCAKEESGSGKPVAVVNGFVITDKAFMESLSESGIYKNLPAAPSAEDRKAFLMDQVRKELLIQTAVKEGLDQDEAFRRTIERYWQQTLIANLLKKQCALCEKGILVTREEVEERHRSKKGQETGDALTDEEVEALASEIREEKKSKALDDWMEELHKNSSITIYEENVLSPKAR